MNSLVAYYDETMRVLTNEYQIHRALPTTRGDGVL